MDSDDVDLLREGIRRRHQERLVRRERTESLDDAAIRRRNNPERAPGQLPRGIGPLNYWLFPSVNRWAHLLNELLKYPDVSITADADGGRAAHSALSTDYALYHQGGDQSAIFEYVGLDTWAFRAPWVVEQIEIWRGQNESKKLHQLMTAYVDGRGRTSPQELHHLITRDQAACRAVLDRAQENLSIDEIIESVANTHNLGRETLWKAYKAYRRLYQLVVPVHLSHDQFFADLSEMAERLRPIPRNNEG